MESTEPWGGLDKEGKALCIAVKQGGWSLRPSSPRDKRKDQARRLAKEWSWQTSSSDHAMHTVLSCSIEAWPTSEQKAVGER